MVLNGTLLRRDHILRQPGRSEGGKGSRLLLFVVGEERRRVGFCCNKSAGGARQAE